LAVVFFFGSRLRSPEAVRKECPEPGVIKCES
jgi:hypothetical protein